MKPCIVVVGYNRPDCLKRILNSISEAVYNVSDVPLVISLDKASDDKGCLEIANAFSWPHGRKSIRTFPERLGLRNHILKCGDLSEEYGSVIILEDDLLVSPMFYEYACKALDAYKDDPIVSGVSLYSHEWNGYSYRFFQPILDGKDVYLGQFSITWGECWTEKWWKAFKEWYFGHQKLDLNNNNLPDNINHWPETSWGKYFITYLIDKNLFYVVPSFSLSTNCSLPGQHAKAADSAHQVRLLNSKDYSFSFPPTSSLMKYDIFFENINLKETLEKEFGNSVTININGKKSNYTTKYLLTTLRIKKKIVRSYGLSLRPIDSNIFLNVEGNSIFLYDLESKGKKPKSNKFEIWKYEFRDFRLSTIRRFYWKYLFYKVRKKLF